MSDTVEPWSEPMSSRVFVSSAKAVKPATRGKPLLLHRIYFDTTVLLEAGWPHVSPRLEQLLSLARELKVRVLLPEAVEREIEEHWVRELVEKMDRATHDVSAIERQLSNVGANKIVLRMPTAKEALKRYRRTAGTVKRQWSVGRIPFSATPVKHFFNLAVTHTSPFRDEGCGFQDAVILRSIVDDMAKHSEAGVIVTNDKGFASADIHKLSPKVSEGSTPRVMTLAEASDVLRNHLDESVQREWREQQNRILDALEASRPALGQLLLKALRVEQTPSLEQVVDLVRVDVTGIDNVTSPSPRELTSGAQCEVSADLKTRISAIVAQSRPVGTYVPVSSVTRPVLGTSQWFQTFEFLVEIQARFSYCDGQFRDFQLLSAKVKSPMGPAFIPYDLGTLSPNTVYTFPGLKPSSQ